MSRGLRIARPVNISEEEILARAAGWLCERPYIDGTTLESVVWNERIEYFVIPLYRLDMDYGVDYTLEVGEARKRQRIQPDGRVKNDTEMRWRPANGHFSNSYSTIEWSEAASSLPDIEKISAASFAYSHEELSLSEEDVSFFNMIEAVQPSPTRIRNNIDIQATRHVSTLYHYTRRIRVNTDVTNVDMKCVRVLLFRVSYTFKGKTYYIYMNACRPTDMYGSYPQKARQVARKNLLKIGGFAMLGLGLYGAFLGVTARNAGDSARAVACLWGIASSIVLFSMSSKRKKVKQNEERQFGAQITKALLNGTGDFQGNYIKAVRSRRSEINSTQSPLRRIASIALICASVIVPIAALIEVNRPSTTQAGKVRQETVSVPRSGEEAEIAPQADEILIEPKREATSSVDGTWVETGYVDFYQHFSEGRFSSEADWRNPISTDLIEQAFGGNMIVIQDGTIRMNDMVGSITINEIDPSVYNVSFGDDGEEGAGGYIAQCGQELRLYMMGELNIYSRK